VVRKSKYKSIFCASRSTKKIWWSEHWKSLGTTDIENIQQWSISPNFSPSKKTPAYGVRQKIRRLISTTKLKPKVIGQNLPNLCAIRKKALNFFARRMLMKSTSGGDILLHLRHLGKSFDM
jgi:hypothetical protein